MSRDKKYSLLNSLPQEIQDQIVELWNSGKDNTYIRNWLAENYSVLISRDKFYYWIEQNEKTKRRGHREAVNIQPKSVEEISKQIEHDKEIESHKAEAEHYKKLYQAAIKESSGMDRIVKTIQDLSPAIPEVKLKDFEVNPKAHQPLFAVAPLCDTHIGERVDLEQMGHLNQYNFDIFNRRLHGWAEMVVSLVKLREEYVHVPKLYVPMLGDMISGDIHLELSKSNLDNVMNQMARGANMIAQALLFLSQHFTEITVPCVVGNHGRMTHKPPAKDKYVDWDYLLYQWTATFCRNQKNIKFVIPKSFMHVFEVNGKKVLIMHGDSINMWNQIPFYGILRTMSQMRQTLQVRQGLEAELEQLRKKNASSAELINVLATYFDYVMLGHFHTCSEIDIGTGVCFICGCMKGGDEYSFGRLHSVSKPSQILTFWHPVHGYVSKDVIYLDRFDNSKKMFVDALPEVWGEENASI